MWWFNWWWVPGDGGFLFGDCLAVKIINKVKMDNDSFYPIMLLVFGVFIFASTYFLKGNGYLAVTSPVWSSGNSRFGAINAPPLRFMDGFVAWMSQILLFLTLGLLVNPSELGWGWLSPRLSSLLVWSYLHVQSPVFLCLAPFRKVGFKGPRLYVSWVGLRGAVPIIFAILPLAAGVPGSRLIFTHRVCAPLVSVVDAGNHRWPAMARMFGGWLKNRNKYRPFQDFDVDFSEEIKSVMTEILITEQRRWVTVKTCWNCPSLITPWRLCR